MTEQNLTVEESYSGLRLDVYLVKQLEGNLSRTFIKSMIDEGVVKVNGRPVKAHHKVSADEKISVTIPEVQNSLENILPEDIPLDIFYEDDYLLVVNKPVGLLVHPVHGQATGTLVNAVMHHCRTLSDVQPPYRAGIVHRLDRETSGLICVAKENRAHIRLARQFEKHRVRKHYAAIVKGSVEYDEGMIDAPLGRHPRHFDKKIISFEEGGREAQTSYKVRKRFGVKATALDLFPKSGRTHQLRVHMVHLGHPILGDDKYGTHKSFPRLALHARGLGFRHPILDRWVEFSSPLPSEMAHPEDFLK